MSNIPFADAPTKLCECGQPAQVARGHHSPRRGSMTERFWRKVQKTDSCWLWTGSKSREHGTINRGPRGAGIMYAHRFSYELHFGAIPEGMSVCHRCDVPLCVNPAHLFLGTHTDNMQDMTKKRRNGLTVHPDSAPKGERHAGSKLTEAQVREIRRLHAQGGMTYKQLGEMYGISLPLAYAVVKRRLWKHID